MTIDFRLTMRFCILDCIVLTVETISIGYWNQIYYFIL